MSMTSRTKGFSVRAATSDGGDTYVVEVTYGSFDNVREACKEADRMTRYLAARGWGEPIKKTYYLDESSGLQWPSGGVNWRGSDC